MTSAHLNALIKEGTREDLVAALSRALNENERLEAAVEVAKKHAKTMTKSAQLVGPVEYQNRPRDMRIWRRALYCEGKELHKKLRAVLALVKERIG